MKKKIAIIGANTPLLHHYKQTKELGYEIHSFAWEEGAVCREFADYFYPISFTQKEEILKICQNIKIDGIISFTLESALNTVNYVAEKMNLPGNPNICTLLTNDKFTVKKALGLSEVSTPKYIIVKSEEELLSVELKFPLIVKPTDSGGSRGVTKVNLNNELLNAYNRALSFSKSKCVMVEEFIEGREFSVEYISHLGKHYFVAITDKVTTGEPYFVELEHHQPADVTEAQKKEIQKITEKTLDVLNVFSSASHTELKMDKSGTLFVIEIGARMGGDMIGSDLVRLHSGYDYVKGCLELACGNFSIPNLIDNKFSGIYYLSKETKALEKYFGTSNKYKEIRIKFKFTEELREIKESGDRSGYIIYQSDHKLNLNENS